MDFDRLKELANAVGKGRLVLDLSCRKKVCSFLVKIFNVLVWKHPELMKVIDLFLKLP